MGSMSAEHYELAHVVQGVTGVMKIAAGLRYADAILAAGYRKPRVVSTAAELDALAVGSVVLDADGDAWQERGYADLNWCCTTYGRNFGMSAANLLDKFGPVTLLHEPEGER